MGKSWRVESTDADFARMLNLRCTHETKHATCEGTDTRQTAYYTPEFADRVLYYMLRYPSCPVSALAIDEQVYLATKVLGEQTKDSHDSCDKLRAMGTCETTAEGGHMATTLKDPSCLGLGLVRHVSVLLKRNQWAAQALENMNNE